MIRATGRPATVVVVVALLFAALMLPATATATNDNSSKLRAAVTLDGLTSHLQAFQDAADDAGGNRFAGLEGHDASAQYVIDTLEAAGYTPTVHEFIYDAFFENTPSQLDQVSPVATTYVNGNDFRVMSYSGSGDVTATLERPSGDHRGCRQSDFAGFTAGNIAIVQRGAPPDFPPTTACTFRLKTDNAIAAGASAVLVYNNVAGVVAGTLGATGLSAIPSLGLTQSLGQSLLTQMQSGPVTMHAKTDTGSEPLTTYNVLAETSSGDPNSVVMVGAHLDSVTTGPGINDNGTGSAAILETAVQMAGAPTKNKVRFAWWSAEESGLIGATRYVQSLSMAEGSKIRLYLNFDMVGSPNFVRFVYDGDNSLGTGTIPAGCVTQCTSGSAAIEQVFSRYFENQALPSEPTPFNGRSDYGPFIAANIPSGGLFTGAEQPKTAAQAAIYGGTPGIAFDPCYHAACDTIANVNPTGFDQMSDAVAHAVITFAQNTAMLNSGKGKGNFKPLTPGSGGGGGLHDHEDEVEA